MLYYGSPCLLGLTIPAQMYLRTDNFTVCILINARENDSILHSAGFDLCLSRPKYVIMSILPASHVFKKYFALLKLEREIKERTLHLYCGAPFHQSKSGFCTWIVQIGI